MYSLVLLFDMEVFYLIWVILEEWKVGGWVIFLTSYETLSEPKINITMWKTPNLNYSTYYI